jgi:hypothetical protein
LAVAALTALAAMLVPNLLRNTAGPASQSQTTPSAGPTTPTGPDTSTTLTVPTQLDPAVQYAAFGWLPTGLTDQWLTTNAASYQLSAYYPGTFGTAENVPSITLTLHPAAEQPVWASPSPGLPQPSGSPTPETTVTLQWLYAPRALAELTVSGLRPGDGTAREIAQRVASTLHYSVDTLPLPLRPRKIPASLPLRQIFLEHFGPRSPQPWRLRMEFSDSATETGGQMFRALVVEATASTARTGDGRKIPDPNTVLAGHPAYYLDTGGGQILAVFDVEAMYVQVWNSDPAITAQLPAGGVKTVFLDLDIHPGNWS